ncbi:DUF917 domain-containing protein [Polyangium jinanense]|uniref:DUF917 domain-containing protein n=1 Tax=Polyangium jinanense TaxID=2829994 RepID=A0A9X3XDF8_9BACT|nr:DUF917 domain-containing protein [Polyangium jinanense]MDC3960965.1 DUF917 domain-containing protein [Polyangium jinanense]MDC3987385.1 DUF917 domain-containing protein [Polyangium jinanense]
MTDALRGLDEERLEDLVLGAGVLGAGGGGNPYHGRLTLLPYLRAGRCPPVVAPEEVPDDALVASVGGMGAPTIGLERLPRGDEELVALRALEAHLGRTVDYLIPAEIGGSNAVAPFVTAAQAGLPVIDADGMGRAFPELQHCTFTIYGVPCTPAAIVDIRHHTALFTRVDDPVSLERLARALTVQMGGAAGFAFPVMRGADMKRTAVRGTLSLAAAVGAAVREARRRHADPIAALLHVTGGQALFHGKLHDVERRFEGGFARGRLTLEGLEESRDERLEIELQNEYLIARRGGEVVASVPDLLCLVDRLTAEPVTTEIARYGLRVLVLGIPAPRLLRTPEALRFVGPRAFGYDVDYRPLPGVYGADR